MSYAEGAAHASAASTMFSSHGVSDLSFDLRPCAAIASTPIRIALMRTHSRERLVFGMHSHGSALFALSALRPQRAVGAAWAEVGLPFAIALSS